jgi:hypothetical protein
MKRKLRTRLSYANVALFAALGGGDLGPREAGSQRLAQRPRCP